MPCIVTPMPPAPHAPCMRALAPSYDTGSLGGLLELPWPLILPTSQTLLALSSGTVHYGDGFL